MATTLAQLLAVREGEKTRAHEALTRAYHQTQKIEPMKGLSRVYQPKDEEGDVFPAESTRVQVRVADLIKEAEEDLVKLFDITAAVESANCQAKASVEVDGRAIVKDVPVTVLLFLEKQLVGLRTFCEKLPVLDPADEWHYEPNQGCYASAPAQTMKTKKTPRVIEKSPATKEHPAQTELLFEDLPQGTWTQTKFSGMLPADRVKLLLKRVDVLQKAVKTAREQANAAPAPKVAIGRPIFDFLFAE